MIPESENSFKKQNVVQEKIKDVQGFVDAVIAHRDPKGFHPERPEALRFVCLQYIKADQDKSEGSGLMKVSPFFTTLEDAKAHMDLLQKCQEAKFDSFILPVGRFLGWPSEACNLEETAAVAKTACFEYNNRIDEFVARRKAAKRSDEEELEKMKARSQELLELKNENENKQDDDGGGSGGSVDPSTEQALTQKADPQSPPEPKQLLSQEEDHDDPDHDGSGDDEDDECIEPDYDKHPELIHIKQGDPAFLRRDNKEQKFAIIRYIRTLGHQKHVLLFSTTAESEDAANTIAEAIHEMRPSKIKDGAPALKTICQTCVVQTQDWVSFPPKVGENVLKVHAKDNPQLEKFLTDEIQNRSEQAAQNVKDLKKWHSDKKKGLFKDEIVDVC